MKQYLLTLLVCTFLLGQLVAQDECATAIPLPNVTNYCSAAGEYSNATATQSPQANPTCFPQEDGGDIWFSFSAIGTDLNVTVAGAIGQGAGGTLQSPQFVIYGGDCTNLTEIQCASDAFNANLAESFAGPLTPGANYYIRVSARAGNRGTFKLCVNNFNSVPDPNSDCPTGVILCDKQAFNVASLNGTGTFSNEIENGNCIGSEFASAWYKWTCLDAGSLTFTLTPNNPTDDLDFALYELPNGIETCSDKELLRCMASGENVGAPFSEWQPCTGATGISAGESDISEDPGCAPNDNNFVSPINMEAGKSYALIVNNFSNNGNGFAIEFGGTGTFLGPQPAFSVNPELGTQCDIDQITFTDNSEVPAGFSASYQWFFGDGANPATASTQGPHDVTYNSFGEKTILLQITTEEGCIVTEVETIYIEPCCPPDAAIDIQVTDSNDPDCAGEAGGSFSVAGTGGIPTYQFSLDGENYQLGSTFNFVPAGDYTVYIVDIKGCIDSIDVTLNDPTPLVVDAGADQFIDLGEMTTLDGELVSFNVQPDVPIWTPFGNFLGDSLIYDPDIFPLTTTTYTLSVTDPLGCNAVDSMTVFVAAVRPLYVPNAFSPNDDGVNDNFTIYGGAGAEEVEYLRIFNRWGGLVFEGTNFPLNSPRDGWDGTINGEKLDTGVYVYVGEVRFIDGITALVKGDVTLIR